MQADTDYDTTQFHALQRVLGALNEGAIRDGLVAVRDGVVVTPRRRRRGGPKASAATGAAETGGTPAKKTKGPDRSPAAAARLLGLFRRQDGDESAEVPGTPFTEAGVTRVLAQVRRRRSKRGGPWKRFLRSVDRYLRRPVPPGIRTVQGVGFERLLVFARQLAEIEAGGWAQFRESRALRRKVVAAQALTLDDGKDAPAEARREGSMR